MSNQSQHPFKWRQFQPEIIVLCVGKFTEGLTNIAPKDGILH